MVYRGQEKQFLRREKTGCRRRSVNKEDISILLGSWVACGHGFESWRAPWGPGWSTNLAFLRLWFPPPWVVTRFWVVNIHVVSLVSKTDKEHFRVVKRIWVVKVDVVSLVSNTDKEYCRVVNTHVVSLASKTDKEYSRVAKKAGSSTLLW